MQFPKVPSQRVTNLWHGLLKEVHLRDGTVDSLVHKFFIGYGDVNDPLRSRFGISWWKSKRYAKIERALALAIRQDLPSLASVSLAEIRRGISVALEDNSLNRLVVNAMLTQSIQPTLHSAYSETPQEKIADVLWERFVGYIAAEFDAWIFLYPLERVTVETGSFSLGEYCLLTAADQPTYLKYCERFPGLRSLDVNTGKLRHDMMLSKEAPLSWLLIEGYGTGDSVLDWGKQRASIFLGVLFSAIRVIPNYSALTASAANANRFATVISAGNANSSFKGADCGPILHSVLGAIEISKQTLDVTSRWLNICIAAGPSVRKRSETAAKWINQATLHGGHVRFLFFFFAIDALFGVRFDVERNILAGVEACMPGDWSNRCVWLFELRSELVHGGSASSHEWRRYEKYCSHFQSEPEYDVEEIAATCLIQFHAASAI